MEMICRNANSSTSKAPLCPDYAFDTPFGVSFFAFIRFFGNFYYFFTTCKQCPGT